VEKNWKNTALDHGKKKQALGQEESPDGFSVCRETQLMNSWGRTGAFGKGLNREREKGGAGWKLKRTNTVAQRP